MSKDQRFFVVPLQPAFQANKAADRRIALRSGLRFVSAERVDLDG